MTSEIQANQSTQTGVAQASDVGGSFMDTLNAHTAKNEEEVVLPPIPPHVKPCENVIFIAD